MQQTDGGNEPQRERGDDMERMLFHKKSGGLDFARLLEQLIPLAVVGAITIYANSLVTQAKVDSLRTDLEKSELERRILANQLSASNEKLVALSAQVTAYLGQQTALNAAMDARITYLERMRPR